MNTQATIPTSALCRCAVCDHDLSSNAMACPHCGEPYKHLPEPPTAKEIAVAVCIGLVVTGLVLSVAYYVLDIVCYAVAHTVY